MTSDQASSYLAIDLGATKAILRMVSGGQAIERTVFWPLETHSAEAELATLRNEVSALCAAPGVGPERTALAAAPNISPDGVVTDWPSRPHWKGVPLLDLVGDAAGTAVLCGDDATLAALAEAHACGCPDLAYMGIGTGVGGGLVSGGHLILGAWGGGAELGHLITSPGGALCRCGQRGCLQTELCAAALARFASARRGRDSTPEELSAGAATGQSWAEDVLDHAASVLAYAVNLVGVIVQPARIHIGGGLGAALTGLPGRVSASLRALRLPGYPAPEVHAAYYGHRSSLAGAELLAMQGERVLRTPLHCSAQKTENGVGNISADSITCNIFDGREDR